MVKPEEDIDEGGEDGEPTTTLTMKGNPKKLKKGMRELGRDEVPKEKEEPESTQKELGKLLQKPDLFVYATRKSPTEIDGRQLVSTVEYPTPTNIPYIKRELEKEFGGHSWFVGVFNESGQKLGGITLELRIPPKKKFEEAEEDAGVSPFIGGQGQIPLGENEDEDVEMDILDQKERLLKKKARIKMLQEYAGIGEEGKKPQEDVLVKMQENFEKAMKEQRESTEKLIAQMKQDSDNKMKELLDVKKDEAHKKEIEAMQKKMDEASKSTLEKSAIDTLKAEIQRQREDFNKTLGDLKDSLKDSGGNKMDSLLKVMSDTNNKTLEMITKSLENKIGTMADSNKSTLDMFKQLSENSANHSKELFSLVANKSENTLDTFGKMMETLRMFNDTMGLTPGGSAEPQDWGSRIANMVEKAVPQVLEYLHNRKKSGEQTTPEQLQEYIRNTSDNLVLELKPFIKEQVHAQLGANPPKELPEGTPTIPAKPTPPAQITPVTKPEANQPKEGEIAMSEVEIKAEISKRVNAILDSISMECDIRPAESEWVDGALRILPVDLLEEIGKCNTQDEVNAILKIYGDIEKLTKLGIKLAMSPKAKEWVESQTRILIEEIREITKKQPQK